MGEFNDQNILEKVEASDYVIFAWGGRSAINRKAYDSRIENLINLIKQCNITKKEIYRVNDQKGSDKYPFHACYWGVLEILCQSDRIYSKGLNNESNT